MSFNMFAFDPSIYTRLNTGVIAAAVQGVYNTRAPSSIREAKGADPYIVFELINGNFDPTFEDNMGEATYRVSVYDHVLNGVEPAIGVISNVYGNSKGTDNNPTVGLARWVIPAVSDIVTAIVRPEDFGTLHSDQVLHYWNTYSVTLQEI